MKTGHLFPHSSWASCFSQYSRSIRHFLLLFCLAGITPLAFAQGTVATPVFVPDAVDAAVGIRVNVTCVTAGAAIYYTIDGTDPLETSQAVPTDGKVLIGHHLTLKAKAFKSGMTPSAVKSSYFRITGGLAAGAFHAVALKSDGKLYSWGAQSVGRLGNGLTAAANVVSPVRVSKSSSVAFDNAADIASYYATTVVVDADGKAWAFGENGNKQVGDNLTTDSAYAKRVLKDNVTYTSAVEANFLNGISTVGAGNAFGMAVEAATGKVWTWGQRSYGRLGSDGYTSSTASARGYATKVTTTDAGNPEISSVVQIAGGKDFAYALSNVDAFGRGQLWAWGANANGQLGQGNTTTLGRASRVKLNATTNLSDVVGMSAGAGHAIMIRRDNAGVQSVWSMGQQSNGRLGNGLTATANVSYPVQVVKSAAQGGGALTNIIQVASAPLHNAALDANGKVWTWGYNADGQLGDGTKTNRAFADTVKVSAGVELTNIVAIAAGG
jgi:alpha-tubulin suppressor-like RCC1 family protein